MHTFSSCRFGIHGVFAMLLLLFAQPLLAECKLNVGWEPWEPYQFEAGTAVSGLDGDLLQALAKEAGCELVWTKLPWKRLLDDLKKGNVDLTSGASKNEEREAYAYFSEPYRDETMVLYVRINEVDKYPLSNFNDMIAADFQVGVVRDYFYGDGFSEAMKNPQFAKLVSDVPTDLQNFKKLEANRLDGVLVDRFVGADLIRAHRLQGKFVVHPLPVNSSGIHLMFSKASTRKEMVERFDKAIQAIKANGTYDQILGKYLQ